MLGKRLAFVALAFMPALLLQGLKSVPQQITPETNPLQEALHCVSPQPVLFPHTKEKTHATRKTRHKTPGSA
jgi:hypothetical protein